MSEAKPFGSVVYIDFCDTPAVTFCYNYINRRGRKKAPVYCLETEDRGKREPIMNADIYLGTQLLELTVHLQGGGSSWMVQRAEEDNIELLNTKLLVGAVAEWCRSEVL